MTRSLLALTVPALCLLPAVSAPAQQPGARRPAHRAYRPVVRPAPPAVRGPARNAVDCFILAALEAKGLALGPEADRPALARRVSFDLTGLPPTPAETDAFLADRAPGAYERLVERYLASPRYGERWGKYWLDAAGYADSNGYFNADSDRPLAWRYRDYVVRAFNEDLPYDRFVQEQLAGDELAGYRPGADVTPDMVGPLSATHFLRNAPDGTGESDGNPDEVRTDRFTVLEGTLQVTMNCLLGVTIQCARCHRHKFEPISQKEYYRLQAVFFPAYNPERWTKPQDRVVPVGPAAAAAAWKSRVERLDLAQKALKKQLDQYERILKGISKEGAKRSAESAALRAKFKAATAALEEERRRRPESLSVLVETDPNPPAHHVLRRGRHNQPGEPVEPGVPAALSAPGNAYRLGPRPPGQVSTGRRLAFARWVTSPENPLFTRVLVNRVWQHHFGTGLVATPDNLGQSGARPTHPELLDYLAAELVRSGWSVKALHRLILCSAVYRQASAPRPDLEKLDADNRLLGRFPLRRLDAEALRDAMLRVAGALDGRVGGPYVPTRRTAEGLVEVAEGQDGARRRSLYLQQRRTQVVTLLQLFDAPAMAATCSVRPTSTVPLQALTLLNSDFVRARARAFSRRLLREAGPDAGRRLTLAFRLACGRPPVADEADAARRFLAAQRQAYAGRADAEERTWADLCQMVLAGNAFLYVD
jgi:hypothetical protein